jgi:hypothetical protein
MSLLQWLLADTVLIGYILKLNENQAAPDILWLLPGTSLIITKQNLTNFDTKLRQMFGISMPHT